MAEGQRRPYSVRSEPGEPAKFSTWVTHLHNGPMSQGRENCAPQRLITGYRRGTEAPKPAPCSPFIVVLTAVSAGLRRSFARKSVN
jgi:hypothetical protein